MPRPQVLLPGIPLRIGLHLNYQSANQYNSTTYPACTDRYVQNIAGQVKKGWIPLWIKVTIWFQWFRDLTSEDGNLLPKLQQPSAASPKSLQNHPAISVRTLRREPCQSIISHPNRLFSFPQSSREFAGRRAGVGYSAVEIASSSANRWPGSRFFCRRSASTANPCHVVSPEPAAW